jgi:hypothetical protein
MIKARIAQGGHYYLAGLFPLNFGNAESFGMLDCQSNRTGGNMSADAAHPSVQSREEQCIVLTQMLSLMTKVPMLSLEVIVDLKCFQMTHHCPSARWTFSRRLAGTSCCQKSCTVLNHFEHLSDEWPFAFDVWERLRCMALLA